MTYVTEQTSAELRAHMRRLTAMPGWHEPLAARLWREIQEMEPAYRAVAALAEHLGVDAGELAERLGRDGLARLTAALELMVVEKCEYMRVNNLGDPEKTSTVKIARTALALLRGKEV